MRVLAATAIYPTVERPAFGSFVRTQVHALRAAGIEVDVFVLTGANRKLMYARAPAELRRRLRAGTYDLVHAHYSYVGAVAATQRSHPVVVTYHGDDILGTRDTRGRITPKSRAIAFGGRWLGEVVDAVVVQSAEMARRLRRDDVHVIPHEVDLTTFRAAPREAARAELGLDPSRGYVLFAASPEIAVKNFPLAQAAVARLRGAGTDPELIVVHRETQPRLALYMSACDVLVFPSWQEGSPNVVKQAMACNLPVVATDVGDVREMIAATRGCHVVARDPDAFARALSFELDRRSRTDGRRAVDHLSCEHVAERLIGVYRGVLAGAAPRRRATALGWEVR